MKRHVCAIASTLLAIFVVTVFSGWCLAEEAKLIPRSVIFGNPEKTMPEISPDGKMMTYLAPLDGVINVWVKTIGKDDDRVVTKDANRGVINYFWAGDGQHIMYLQDKGGNENWLLYDVSLQTGEERALTPYENVQVEVVGRDKHFPTHLVIAMNKDNPQLHDVYHVNLTTGEITQVAKNPGNVLGWLTDNYLQVRIAIAANAEGGMDMLYRGATSAEWKKIATWGTEDNLSTYPIGFTEDGRSLYLTDSRGANATKLVRLDIETGAKTVLAEDSLYDVSGVMINPDTYKVEAVAFTKDRDEWEVLDPAVKADFDAIRKIHEGDFAITSRDNADQTWIIHFTVDNGPVPFYAYDRRSKSATFLFYSRPVLKGYTLAPMQPVAFQSRDGLTVHGYLTCPPGIPRTDLPLVLNVHGGPWYRDTWGYNAEAQWLANRGYACLQVNFRGSTGYGKAFTNAGDREWGGKMHNDLIDAVNWAVAQGIADPKRVAIYGGSYGGYAALVGATFTPDVFACAVDMVGPSNLVSFLETVPPYWTAALQMFYKRIGNPKTEPEFLKSRSPLFKVDAIKIPMLIAQGANDPRVNKAESEQVVAAMQAKGIDHEYLLFEDEGHGFLKPENRLKFYAAAEKFLAKHIGGRYEE
jgi:dipeptidyl aminopeptidase/acylaminoacyl peptidase